MGCSCGMASSLLRLCCCRCSWVQRRSGSTSPLGHGCPGAAALGVLPPSWATGCAGPLQGWWAGLVRWSWHAGPSALQRWAPWSLEGSELAHRRALGSAPWCPACHRAMLQVPRRLRSLAVQAPAGHGSPNAQVHDLAEPSCQNVPCWPLGQLLSAVSPCLHCAKSTMLGTRRAPCKRACSSCSCCMRRTWG